MIFPIWNVEEGCLPPGTGQLTSGSPFNNLRNKLQAENRDSQIISISQQQQINSVNNRVLSAVLWQSYMHFVRRLCIRCSFGVCCWWWFPVWTAECQLFCSSLVVFWQKNVCFLATVILVAYTAQDIQNVAYVASNCQNQSATAELSHILHLFFCNFITVAAGQSNWSWSSWSTSVFNLRFTEL